MDTGGYRISVRGQLPADLAERISAVHAAAILSCGKRPISFARLRDAAGCPSAELPEADGLPSQDPEISSK